MVEFATYIVLVSISRGMGTDITINVIHIMFSARLIAGVVPAMRNVGRARSLILMPTPQTMHPARSCPKAPCLNEQVRTSPFPSGPKPGI